MARSVLLSLLGSESSAVRALRNVGDESDRTADRVDRLDESGRRADGSHGRLTATLARLAPAAGQAAMGVASVAAGLGAAVPVAAGLAAVLVQVAPAAAVAATGLVAMGLASTALKIGMSGVGEAVSAALNPADPAAYAEALAKLSPNARAFVGEIHKLQPAFAAIKTAVQDTLFQGLDKSFASAAKTTLPIFREGLVGAAEALNGMGKNLLSTIEGLGKSGTLSTLFDGATAGLKNLERVPGQLVKAFAQVGAAAAPMFQKMTGGIGAFADRASKAISGAFKSGAMDRAISTAVGLLRQLGQVAANVFKIVSDVFGAAEASGGGFVGVLNTITGALAQITGNPAFQQGLQAIFGVIQQLATTAAPLLAQALLAIGPIFAALGPPIEVVIQALGQALQPVIAALGPVLAAAAEAFGALIVALAPLLPVIGQIIAAVLPVLIPVFQLLTTIFTALTPVIAIVAQALTTYLVPVITTVVGVVTKVVEWFKNLAEQVFPVLVEAVTGASGPFTGLGTALQGLWDAVQPLILALGNLAKELLEKLQPAIEPIKELLGKLAEAFKTVLAAAINEVVIPAIQGLTDLLNGDANAALQGYASAAKEAADSIVTSMASLPEKTAPAIGQWAIQFSRAVAAIGTAVKNGFDDMYADVEQVMLKIGLRIPGALRAAVGAVKSAAAAIGNAMLNGLELFAPQLVLVVGTWIRGMTTLLRAVVPTMVSIGKSIIGGLVSGIKSAIPDLSGALGAITSLIPSWKGPPEKDAKLLHPAGVSIMGGLIDGIDSQLVKLKGKLREVTETVMHSFSEGSISLVPIGDLGKKLRQALTKGADEIADVVKEIRGKIADAFKAKSITAGQRDDLLDYLGTTNKKLKDLATQREKIVDKIKEIQDYAAKVTQSVLSYAAITNIKGDDGAAANGAQLVAGLQARLATIREFGGNLKKLAAAGLSKAILGQILDAGIDGGAAIAAELANGPASIIAALNTTQTQITKIAKGIGLDGADALFGSGKAMGEAFLKGLKSLEKALVDSMEELLEKLLKALGLGVDKAKGKLVELVETSAKLREVVETTMKLEAYTPPPKNTVPTPLIKAPSAPAPMPKYEYVPPKGGGAKNVSVNLGGVTIRERADVTMLMNASAFAARSLQF